MISNISLDVLNTMSLSELDVFKFIDSNKPLILEYSIQNLAKRMFVSTATIMRLCKKLGFSGFSELKYYLKEEISRENRVGREITFEALLNGGIRTITETAKLLNEKKIINIVNLMKKAQRIHFFGKGLTNSIIQYASKILLTKGYSNFFYEDTHIAYIMAEKMNEDDLIFLCSLSGNTHQVVRTAQIAKSRKAKVISITENTVNELSKIGDVNIGIYNDTESVHPADISSRLSILFVLDIIACLFMGNAG